MSSAATLVVGPSWVGDMVMAQSLFKLLKERSPDTEIDVLAPGWSLPVVARMPEIRRGIDAATAHGEAGLATRRKIGRELRGDYAQAIVLPRSFKSALVPWFARVPKRTGYRGEMRFGLLNDIRPFDPAKLDQTVKRYTALGLEPGEEPGLAPFPELRVSGAHQRETMARLKLATERPVIAFMPGAEYGPAKCWPMPHFAALAQRLLADGYAIWVLGSQKDAKAGEAIVAEAGNPDAINNLCGKTSLEDVVDLLGFVQQAVSNDSGLMHVAAAVGTHVHAIYGSSTPAFTPPLTLRQTTHYLSLECSPCFERQCPLEHLNCLRQISPESVHASILQQS